MQNLGEEIAGEYLKVVKNCEFIEYNLHIPYVQWEIDVVGVDIKNKKLYVCEVATHLAKALVYNSKLKYIKNGRLIL